MMNKNDKKQMHLTLTSQNLNEVWRVLKLDMDLIWNTTLAHVYI